MSRTVTISRVENAAGYQTYAATISDLNFGPDYKSIDSIKHVWRLVVYRHEPVEGMFITSGGQLAPPEITIPRLPSTFTLCLHLDDPRMKQPLCVVEYDAPLPLYGPEQCQSRCYYGF